MTALMVLEMDMAMVVDEAATQTVIWCKQGHTYSHRNTTCA